MKNWWDPWKFLSPLPFSPLSPFNQINEFKSIIFPSLPFLLTKHSVMDITLPTMFVCGIRQVGRPSIDLSNVPTHGIMTMEGPNIQV